MKAKILLTLLCLFSAKMVWAQSYTQDAVNYDVEKETAYVSSSPDATGDITILDKITVEGKDYPVTEVGYQAFYENTNITSVVIPNSVETIGINAFRGCSSLEIVTIGSGVTSIDGDSFYSCPSLTDVYMYADPDKMIWEDIDFDDFMSDGSTIIHVDNANAWNAKFAGLINAIFRDKSTIPYSYSYNEDSHTLTISGTEPMPKFQSRSDRPWHSYASEIESVVIEDGVFTIGQNAFADCIALTSVSIPNSVSYIGRLAFDGCVELAKIYIPSSVKVIDDRAFSSCLGLTSISLPASVSFHSIISEVFEFCYGLNAIYFDENHPLYKTIGGEVYSKDGTCYVCCPPAKTSVAIVEGVEEIGSYAFSDCKNLTSVKLPNGLRRISSYVFKNCTGLSSISLPDGMENISSYAFEGCYSLAHITIPASYIGNEAFIGCVALESVSFGPNVLSVASTMFSNCSSLKDFYVDKDNPYFKSILGILCTKDGTEVRLFPSGRTKAVIPEGVTSLYDYSFANSPNLTSVKFPSTLVTIGSYAFTGCNALQSVTIPHNVQTIGYSAFRSCKALTSVTIGSGVTSIGADAFYDSRAITDVYMYADPDNLSWKDADYDEFMNDKATICHVFNAEAFKAKWDVGDNATDVRCTFVGDLLPCIDVTNMDGSYLTTYYNGTENVKVDAGTQIFKVVLNNNMLSAAEIEGNIIKAGEGVILKSKCEIVGAATADNTEECPDEYYSGNVLEGVDVDTAKPAGYKYYTLALNQNDLSFFEVQGNTLLAHKAYYRSSAGSSDSIDLDNATGINEIQDAQGLPGTVYNLAGQRLGKMQRGINIIGGRKVIVK